MQTTVSLETLLEDLVYNIVNGWPITPIIRKAAYNQIIIAISPSLKAPGVLEIRVGQAITPGSTKVAYMSRLVDVSILDTVL